METLRRRPGDAIPEIILASGSPRRRRLLSGLNIGFKTVAPDVDETYDEGLSPQEIAKRISLKKANEVHKQYPLSAVIAADTIVVIEGEILGKPGDKAEAASMLGNLSGSWHEVHTGICILHDGTITQFCETTRVHFKELDRDFINWYVGTGEPMDKAGAYGIQGYGAMLVDRIEGDFYNVMGFPVSRIMGELERLDIYKFGRG